MTENTIRLEEAIRLVPKFTGENDIQPWLYLEIIL